MIEMFKCPWKLVGSDDRDASTLYWCDKCGSLLRVTEKQIADMPSSIDRETLYCPDQGYVP